MSSHPLHRFIQAGDFQKVESYFKKKVALCLEEKDLLLSGLQATK